MRIQETVYCPECGSEKCYASMSAALGLDVKCQECGYKLELELVPHPSLGRLVWSGVEEE